MGGHHKGGHHTGGRGWGHTGAHLAATGYPTMVPEIAGESDGGCWLSGLVFRLGSCGGMRGMPVVGGLALRQGPIKTATENSPDIPPGNSPKIHLKIHPEIHPEIPPEIHPENHTEIHPKIHPKCHPKIHLKIHPTFTHKFTTTKGDGRGREDGRGEEEAEIDNGTRENGNR